jgi:hypothetical protein
MGANNQILPCVKSERYLVEKYDSGLQPMVFSKKGRIGVIGINPAAINSVNPSSRGVASRNQDGKPFGVFLQAHQSKKLLKKDTMMANKCSTKSKVEMSDDHVLL